MITAVDTNILVALLTGTVEEAPVARRSLSEAIRRGSIIVCAPVYAELVAASGRGEEAVDELLGRARIEVDWELDEETWHVAARTFREYTERRRAQPGVSGPRRLLADFVVGAHASRYASALLTLDRGIYRAAFPGLEVLIPE